MGIETLAAPGIETNRPAAATCLLALTRQRSAVRARQRPPIRRPWYARNGGLQQCRGGVSNFGCLCDPLGGHSGRRDPLPGVGGDRLDLRELSDRVNHAGGGQNDRSVQRKRHQESAGPVRQRHRAASIGASMPRLLRSRSTSAHDSVDSPLWLANRQWATGRHQSNDSLNSSHR